MLVISSIKVASAVSTGSAVRGVNKVVINLAKKIHRATLLFNNEHIPKSCNKLLCWRC